MFGFLFLLCNLLLAESNIIQDFNTGIRFDDSYPCTADHECVFLGDFKCVNETCSCPSNTNCQDLDITEVTTLGETCDHTRNCHIDNSVCSEQGKCACQENFVESVSRKACVEGKKRLGEPCNEDGQCHSAFCYQQICKRRAALGETCRTSEECNFLNEFSYCKAGKCMCTERYVAYRGKCYLIARELLSPCQLDVQCKESLGEAAKCLEEKCVCSNGRSYEAFSRKCVLNSGSRNSWAHSSRWIALIISFAIIYL